MLYLTTYAGLLVLRFARWQNLYGALLVAMFLFSAFRFEVGCDWPGYLNQFSVNRHLPFSELFAVREPLWAGAMALQNSLQLPYPWINVFSSAVFFWGAHLLARRQPDRLAFMILLFPILVINMPMSGIRQATAIGIMCIAFVAFNDRRLVRFVALTVLAAGFHSSALVFLLLAPLVKGAYTRGRLALSVLLALPGALALLSTEAAELAVERYVDTGIDAFGAAFRVGLLVLTALFFFMYLNRKWTYLFTKDYKLVLVGSLMMISLVFMIPISTVIGDRLGYYLVPIQAMIFARLPYIPLNAHRHLFIAAPYLGLLLVLAVWTSRSRHFQLCYIPYESWLFGFPVGRGFFY